MRVTGFHNSNVLGRTLHREFKTPHLPLRGTFSRGEKGMGIGLRLVGAQTETALIRW